MTGYHSQNVFAKILRGEIPCQKLLENDHVLAFPDITPRAPVHVLVIPKGAYADMDDFTARASVEEMAAVMKAIGDIARQMKIDKDGYRVITNCKEHGRQEVPHLHFHVLGGAPLPKMI